VNIQIFGVAKSADTRKAERYFKERRIKFQSVDLKKYGMSGGEFDSVLRAVGGLEQLVDWDSKSPELDLLKYLSSQQDKEDKVYDHQELIRLPVVRNGKKATVGYCPEIWATWE
jgi:arsenate reductase-like glutaredoxin family protein